MIVAIRHFYRNLLLIDQIYFLKYIEYGVSWYEIKQLFNKELKL